MIAAPWNVILTIAFLFTAAVCVWDLVAGRRAATTRTGGLTDDEVVDINHTVMSVAMIVMIWISVWETVTWTQIALFAIFGLALLTGFARTRSTAGRVSLAGHVMLDAAMIWMLAAMPLLMSGTDMGGGGHAGHAGHDGGEMAMSMSAPVWALIVNGGFVVLCTAAALWWLTRLATARGFHRVHALCHAVMAAGMGVMLVLMAA